jgi:hypothetical protein
MKSKKNPSKSVKEGKTSFVVEPHASIMALRDEIMPASVELLKVTKKVVADQVLGPFAGKIVGQTTKKLDVDLAPKMVFK